VSCTRSSVSSRPRAQSGRRPDAHRRRRGRWRASNRFNASLSPARARDRSSNEDSSLTAGKVAQMIDGAVSLGKNWMRSSDDRRRRRPEPGLAGCDAKAARAISVCVPGMARCRSRREQPTAHERFTGKVLGTPPARRDIPSARRFTRVKHDVSFPHGAIRFCFDPAGLRSQDLEYVPFFEKPLVKFERILQAALITDAAFPMAQRGARCPARRRRWHCP
jgi:hypothetical protein